MIGLICVLRVSLSIFNCIAQAWPKLQSKNKIKNALVKWKGKNENLYCISAGYEQQTKGGRLSFLNHKFFFLCQCFKKLISILTLRIISVLMSDDLLTSHRRWLLSWICALKLIVREAKKELMKKIVHELYLYRVFSFDFHFNEWQNDGNFLDVR